MLQKTFDPYFHLIHQEDLPQNSFNVNGDEHDVPCVLQIWLKKGEKRKIAKTLVPNDTYTFVKKDQSPDIAFRRVGVYAGKITKDFADKSDQSHYFIKFSGGVDIDDFLKKFKKVVFDTDNTVGPKSISKQELMKVMNEN